MVEAGPRFEQWGWSHTDNECLGKLLDFPRRREAARTVITSQHQRHRFKNTASIGIDAHNRAGPVP